MQTFCRLSSAFDLYIIGTSLLNLSNVYCHPTPSLPATPSLLPFTYHTYHCTPSLHPITLLHYPTTNTLPLTNTSHHNFSEHYTLTTTLHFTPTSQPHPFHTSSYTSPITPLPHPTHTIPTLLTHPHHMYAAHTLHYTLPNTLHSTPNSQPYPSHTPSYTPNAPPPTPYATMSHYNQHSITLHIQHIVYYLYTTPQCRV